MRYALLRTVENVKKGSDALRAVLSPLKLRKRQSRAEKVKKGRSARNYKKFNSKFNKMFFCSTDYTDLTFGRVCSRSEKLMQASLFSRLIAAFTEVFKHELPLIGH